MEFEDFKDLPEEAEQGTPTQSLDQRPVIQDLRTGRKYPIPSYPLFIGREKYSSICIPVPAISRRHAKIFEREGVFYIQDMGSINGTFVNDKRILDPIALKEGDRVKVGVTKKYPKGAREFIFKSNVSEEERLEKEKNEERDRILKEVGVTPGPAESKKIVLRHCVFNVAKKELVAIFKAEEYHRVPLLKLDIGHSMLSFLDLSSFRVRDTVTMSLEHPRLPEPLKITLRILGVNPKPVYGIIEHKCLIIKISEKHKAILENMIVLSDMICYMTSRRLSDSIPPADPS